MPHPFSVVLHTGFLMNFFSYYDNYTRQQNKGNCLNNAVMENFFGTLKSEYFYLNRYSYLNELKKATAVYIYYYNNERTTIN